MLRCSTALHQPLEELHSARPPLGVTPAPAESHGKSAIARRLALSSVLFPCFFSGRVIVVKVGTSAELLWSKEVCSKVCTCQSQAKTVAAARALLAARLRC